jgi:hypothetical protein
MLSHVVTTFSQELFYSDILEPECYAMIMVGNEETVSWDKSVEAVLDYMVRTDDPSEDTLEQQEVRRLNSDFHGDLPVEDIQEEEVGMVISSLPRKTPGPDKMEVQVLQKVWELYPDSVHRVLAKCLEMGCFPKIWKRGELCLLRKSPEAPSSSPSSYRPICLLPILGKVLEKIVARRVGELYRSAGLEAPNRYGFKKGFSVMDAVKRVVGLTRGNTKYIAGIFVDFTGAFDTLWWPSILARLRLMNCPANLYALITDYLRDREVMIRTSHQERIKEVRRGCPQGSVLGPLFWNFVMDEYLTTESRFTEKKIAYADDLAIVLQRGRSLKGSGLGS